MKIFSLTFSKIFLPVFIISGLFHNKANAQLKLYSSGNLSIGSVTQPPARAELQVIGNSLFSKNTGASISSAYIKGMNIFSSDSLPDYSWWGDTITGFFHPSINTIAFSNSGRESMRITSASNVLLGATADNGDRLQVTGILNTNPFDIYSNCTALSGYSGVNWLNDTNIKAWTVKYNNLDKFYVYGNGQAYSFGWNTMSDSTLKDNVRPIGNALEKVLKLQGVTYNLKQLSESADNTSKIISQPSSVKMGLIAQAVERVTPEVVTITSDGMKTVAYGNLVGLLIEAIKQEDTKVNTLQHKLDSCVAFYQHQTNLPEKEKAQDTSSANQEQAKLYPCKTCPVNENTSFHCFIPSGSKDASIMVFNINGELKKSISIDGRKEQFVSFNDNKLSAGLYYYSLVVDGQEVDTKKIILTEQIAGN